jgi:argininosuccinate lyase
MSYSKEIIEFHRYAPGVPEAPEKSEIVEKFIHYLASLEKDPTKHSGGPNRHKVDMVWIVCMKEAGVFKPEAARKLLDGVIRLQQGKTAAVSTRSHGFAERNLIAALDNDEDLASMINLGRTLQEPMSRLDLRDKTLEMLDALLSLQASVLKVAGENISTVMPGYTHLSQAQPITLAHYLLSIYDGVQRGLEQLELAYRFTNRNSGGCGACSGITWPLDRWRMTCLLGFDDLVEPTYDSESSQDHSLSILFALTNLTLLMSKASMDMNIWTMEETGMAKVDPSWCGVSSMMPQKCIPGSFLERVRIEAAYVISHMTAGVSFNKGEPHADMLPMLEVPKVTQKALAHAELCTGCFEGILNHLIPRPEIMLQHVRAGYSCSSEVAAHMVKELGYGPRRAHRIVATLVRLGRERNLKAFECTGDFLDEAARFADEREPKIDTATLRRLLDPHHFIGTHTNTGGTAPAEAKRMLNIRREALAAANERQDQRRAKLAEADVLLKQVMDGILAA